jgi:hypothetical protein
MRRWRVTRRSIALLGLAVATVPSACGSSASEHGTGGAGPGAGGAPPALSALGGPDCPALGCLGCAQGTDCAAAGPVIEGTCCALGDPLVRLAEGVGAEVVDMEFDGRFAFLCGGFGVRISDLQTPSAPKLVAQAAARCQRIAVGPTLGDGTRVFYLAHHGDTWVPDPFLATYHLSSGGDVTAVGEVSLPALSYEGLAWAQGHLYVATHAAGLRVYATAPSGVPAFVSSVGGFVNAWKVAVDGERAYVADAEGGLKVLSLANPSAPVIEQSIETVGPARDVEASGGRVFVAMGGAGVDVFDIGKSGALSRAKTLSTRGSAQAVSASGGLLSVAAWNHVALYDAERLTLLATERTRERFEQDLAVVVRDDLVLVGEWEGLHVLRHRPGFVAPDLGVVEDLITFPPGEKSVRAIVVENRGRVPLEVESISVSGAALSTDVASLTVPPGAKDFFELRADAPAGGSSREVQLATNDPDPFDLLRTLPVEVSSAAGLGVGASLPQSFAFLHPAGLDGLKGKVTLLSYFALF